MKAEDVYKRIALILLLLLLPVMALAQTQEEWNLSCNWKTSCATPVLATGTREPKGTISANTYVKITGTLNDDLCIIQYMINGQTTKGVVSRSNSSAAPPNTENPTVGQITSMNLTPSMMRSLRRILSFLSPPVCCSRATRIIPTWISNCRILPLPKQPSRLPDAAKR